MCLSFFLCKMGPRAPHRSRRETWWITSRPSSPQPSFQLACLAPSSTLHPRPASLTCLRTRHSRPGGAAPAAGPPTLTARPYSRSRLTEAAQAHLLQTRRCARYHSSRQSSRALPAQGPARTPHFRLFLRAVPDGTRHFRSPACREPRAGSCRSIGVPCLSRNPRGTRGIAAVPSRSLREVANNKRRQTLYKVKI